VELGGSPAPNPAYITQVKLSMHIYNLFQRSSLPQTFLLTLQLSYKFSDSWI